MAAGGGAGRGPGAGLGGRSRRGGRIAGSLAVGGTAGMDVAGVLLRGAGEFVVLAGGGALAGAAVAAGAIAVRRRVTDPVLETVAALLTPYVAYLLGEVLHVSGV